METNEFIDLVQKHMVKWSEKEDSDLWNKRVDALIDLVKEIDGRDHEPKNGKG
jgi:hypothetical protein